jgi:predicted AlkP superfamily pyrophosphatase or phosphodiesterase
MINRYFTYSLILVICTITLSSCKSDTNPTDTTTTINSEASIEKPYLILISLDGFRWDYVEKYNPPNIGNFIQNGVKAESLIPSFPSKTFPNHYTIATGMYPDKHGILGNNFYSYKKGITFKKNKNEMYEDGSFFGGSPIWIQANKASMVTASYFFVGTEANIQGIRPTYYYQYDHNRKNEKRVDQALKWLEMPEKSRPHLITLYFSDMDNVGHKFGPNNDEELKKSLFKLDKNLGDLFNGTAATGLPINIIIVSDHGMTTVPASNFMPIEDIENDNLFSIIDNGSILNIHPKKNVQVDRIIQYLKQKENNFKVYKTENTPGFEYIPKNKDWGAVQIIPDFGYYFINKNMITSRKKSSNATFGVHGYDTKYKDMHGVFYANGPAFKKDYAVPSLKNIHVYPLMCQILGLEIPNDIDGNLNQIKSVLKKD